MKKRKLIATSLAVILAVALAAGGTLAYLSGTSKTATNNVANDFNWVSLTETDTPGTITTDGDNNITNTGYEIIPGTSQNKKPTVNVSYSIDSYVYVAVEDTSGGLITWAAASGWTLLTGTDEYDSDGNLTKAVYYRLVDENDKSATQYTESNTNVVYYTNSFSVLDGDSISYSSSITNSQIATFDTSGNPSFLNTEIKLVFQAYIMQADISGTGSADSALSCWNALNAGNTTNTVSVNAGNVAVTTTNNVTITEAELVAKSASSAYSATVPAGVVIDTTTADIVTSGNTTTTTLILVVEEVGTNYTSNGLNVTTSAGQTATVYDVSIIGVDNKNNTTVMEIAMDIGTGLYNVKVEHEGNDLTALTEQQSGTAYTDNQYYYDSTTGILYIYTNTFSEFAIYSMKSAYASSDGKTGYDSLDAAIAASNVAVNEDTKVVYSSLSSAISAASDGDTVTLLVNVTLDSTITIDRNITFDLAGSTLTRADGNVVKVNGNVTLTDSSDNSSGSISGGNSSGVVFVAANASLTMESGTITGKSSTASTVYGVNLTKSAVFTMDGGTIEGCSSYGVYVNCANSVGSTFTMNGGTISGNKSGVFVSVYSTFTMNGGTIDGCSSYGVYINYASSGGSNFTMNDGTISGNNSGVYVSGGGVSGQSTFTMNGGTISGNTAGANATQTGGGVTVHNASFTMNGGTITGNTHTEGAGGGVYVNANGTFTMNGGTISNNTAGTYGGGVYLKAETSVFTMTGGSIINNTATKNGGGVYFNNASAGLNVSGSPVINNNTVSSSANNVYLLKNAEITLTGELSSGASIGVTVPSNSAFPVQITATESTTAYYTSATNYISSDSSSYTVQSKSTGGYLELTNTND